MFQVKSGETFSSVEIYIEIVFHPKFENYFFIIIKVTILRKGIIQSSY